MKQSYLSLPNCASGNCHTLRKIRKTSIDALLSWLIALYMLYNDERPASD